MVIIQPIRLSEKITPLIELRANKERVSKSTAIRQFMYEGLEEYALNLCKEGRISIGKAAELLDKTIYEMQDLAREKGIVLSASEESQEKSEETRNKILQKLKA